MSTANTSQSQPQRRGPLGPGGPGMGPGPRGMLPGEVWGITRADMIQLLEAAGFKDVQTKPFILGQNTLYIGQKPQ